MRSPVNISKNVIFLILFLVGCGSGLEGLVENRGGNLTPESENTHQEINIQQSGSDIASAIDTYDFGNIAVNPSTPPEAVFTIENLGDIDLNVVSIDVTGDLSFTLTSDPSPAVITGSSSVSFSIEFNPSSLGLNTATITINSDDEDEPVYTFTVEGTGVATEQEINVRQSGTGLVDGSGTYDYGNVSTAASAPPVTTFTIENLGGADLNLADISLSGDSSFALTVDPSPATILSSGSVTFNVQFTPGTNGSKTATVTITSNDIDENPYTFTLEGVGVSSEQEINVHQSGTGLADGTGTYDYGSIVINPSAPPVITFTIQNLGDADLHIDGISISGDSSFAITSNPSPALILSSGFVTFNVEFDPSSTGYKSAIVTISNDDSDEEPYTFIVEGTGSAAEQEINIHQSGTNLADGAGIYDYGNIVISPLTPPVTTFTIENLGGADLNISDISLSGDSSFTLTVDPSPATILSSNSVTFNLQFNPASTGLKTGTLTVNSNDSDEEPYTFTLNGTGAATEQEINIYQSGTNLADGAGSYDFGNVASNPITPPVTTFTIENLGGADLNIADITITGDASFTLTVDPSPVTILSSSSVTFNVQYNPTATGPMTGTVTVNSNDSNEEPYTFTLEGAGVATAQEIYVHVDGTELADGSGTYGFGNIVINPSTPPVTTFTIENPGGADLHINDISISGDSSFTITSNPSPTVILASGSATFNIEFDPSTIGLKTATLTITNNDDNENPYTFSLNGTGTATAQEINVRQSGTGLADGSGTYDYGNVAIGATSPPVITFTIENLGEADLSVDSIGISGDSSFILMSNPSPAVILGTGSVTFNVEFDPGSTGLKTATITIGNDDSNETPYTFTLQGTGVTTEQEIYVNYSGTDIPDLTGTYDYGNIVINPSTPPVITFTIQNLGGADLHVDSISISGSSAFSITSDPSPVVILSSNTVTFNVQFDPSSVGYQSATVTINNNDSDENPYTFVVEGTGSAAEQEIYVHQSGTDLPDGAGNYDYGNIVINPSTPPVTTFTIENTGGADLDVTSISLSGDSSFSLTVDPSPAKILSSNSVTFNIRFNPTSTGLKTGSITINNNDTNEDPYTFTLEGTGTATEQEINIHQAGTNLIDGAGIFDFGNIVTNPSTPPVKTFSIENLGGADLNVTDISISGDSSFTLTSDPSPATIESSNSVTFNIQFNPASTGLKTGTVTVNNNDSNEEPYTFTLNGTGTATAQEIYVHQGGSELVDGSGIYNFNDTMPNLSTPQSTVFTIQNQGGADLYVYSITITGDSSFTLTSNPSPAVIISSGTVVFDIEFDPSTVGPKTATVTISNDDSNEDIYTFTLNGTAQIPQDIEVTQNGTLIADGTGLYNFVNTEASTTSATAIFIIENTGSSDLSVSSISLSGTNPSLFSIIDNPTPATVPASGKIYFGLAFSPDSAGSKAALVTIVNDDPDENPYTFDITGTGSAITWTGGSKNITESTGYIASGYTSLDVSGTNVYVAYYATNNSGSLVFQKSTDGGNTWLNPATLVDSNGTGQHCSLEVVRDRNSDGDDIYISYVDNNALGFARSTDGGSTWSYYTPDSSTTRGQYSSISIVPDPSNPDNDHVHIGYLNTSSEDLMYVYSSNGGQTWNSPVTVESTGTLFGDNDVGKYSSLYAVQDRDANSGDEIYISYYENNGEIAGNDCNDLLVSHSLDGGTSWTDVTADNPLPWVEETNRGMHTSIVVLPHLTNPAQDKVYVSYYDYQKSIFAENNHDLVFAYSTNGGSSFSFKTIDSSGDVGQYTSIDAAGSNIYISSYHTGGNLRFAKSTTGGSSFTTSTITTISAGTTSLKAEGSTLYVSSIYSGNLRVSKSINYGSSW